MKLVLVALAATALGAAAVHVQEANAAGGSNAAGEASTEASAPMVGDPMAGEEMYQSVCRNCHGPTAKGMASFPRLAGQDPEYLSEALRAYRAGETMGYNTALMAPHAKELSDQDIADLTAYIATLE